MFKGFYNLTSGMLTQQRDLNVVGNNLVNVSTAGFKQDRYTATTFDQVMYSRAGNKYKDYEEIGEQSYIRGTSRVYTTYDQGVMEPTGIMLDFGIEGDGFFAIQRDDGEIVYTRTGSFSLDEDGVLWFSSQGRVLNPQGETIQLGTDKITADSQGRIYAENGALLGQLGVYAFEDNGELEHNDQGMFVGDGAQVVENPVIYWKHLERSNVDMIQQMTEMLTCQRALQSAAEVSRIYEELMTKAANSVGQM